MVKAKGGLRTKFLTEFFVEEILHRARNPLAGASALLQLEIQKETTSEHLFKSLDCIDVVADILSEAEMFFSTNYLEENNCLLSDFFLEVPDRVISIDSEVLKEILNNLPGSVNVVVDSDQVYLYFGHNGEINLTADVPLSNTNISQAIQIGAYQRAAKARGGTFYWSGNLLKPSPFTLMLKVIHET